MENVSANEVKNEIKKKKQKELFRKLADEYANVRENVIFTRMFYDFLNGEIMDYLPRKKNAVVLDTMCGTGDMFKSLVGDYDKVVGLDISEDMLHRVRDKENLLGLVCGDVDFHPFKHRSFDLVVCRAGLHHLPDISNCLYEVNRILRRNGIFVFSEPSDDSFAVRQARQILHRHNQWFEEDTESGFFSKELDRLLSKHNFRIAERKRFGYIAHVLFGHTDILPVFRKLSVIPGIAFISRVLIFIDKCLSVTPFVKKNSLFIIMKCVKSRE